MEKDKNSYRKTYPLLAPYLAKEKTQKEAKEVETVQKDN